ncbi:hypothetical protein LQL77_32710, partial [Rhodococcus cerastii]|nr:hypothetical protein [Rhodococcus cerastii]
MEYTGGTHDHTSWQRQHRTETTSPATTSPAAGSGGLDGCAGHDHRSSPRRWGTPGGRGHRRRHHRSRGQPVRGGDHPRRRPRLHRQRQQQYGVGDRHRHQHGHHHHRNR